MPLPLNWQHNNPCSLALAPRPFALSNLTQRRQDAKKNIFISNFGFRASNFPFICFCIIISELIGLRNNLTLFPSLPSVKKDFWPRKLIFFTEGNEDNKGFFFVSFVIFCKKKAFDTSTDNEIIYPACRQNTFLALNR